MRHPSQGMPVSGMACRERPPNSLQRNSVLNMNVFAYVLGVIKVNEAAQDDWPECREGGNGQENVNRLNLILRHGSALNGFTSDNLGYRNCSGIYLVVHSTLDRTDPRQKADSKITNPTHSTGQQEMDSARVVIECS